MILAEEILEGPQSSTGEPYFTNMNDPNLALMRGNRSISTHTVSTMFRASINCHQRKGEFSNCMPFLPSTQMLQ